MQHSQKMRGSCNLLVYKKLEHVCKIDKGFSLWSGRLTNLVVAILNKSSTINHHQALAEKVTETVNMYTMYTYSN